MASCSYGNSRGEPAFRIASKTYRARGVALVGVNANAHEAAEQVAEHAKAYHASFPVLKDPDNIVADLARAKRTCEAIVLDDRGEVRYRGAIDDQYTLGAHKAAPTKHYLIDALDALLAGRSVALTETRVVGCLIDRIDPPGRAPGRPKLRAAPPEIIALRQQEAEAAVEVGPVSYASGVAAVLQAKCQPCHRPGQAAPFSLLTYEQARRWGPMIREVVAEYRMPPWHADPRFGRFENDRSLSPRERAMLLAWVEQGMPKGDPKAIPKARAFTDGWSIGRPDLVLEMPQPYTVPAEGTVPYQVFRVPTDFSEDVWVQAAEARPGDRQVVHHVCVFIDDGTAGGRLGDMPELACYAPGDIPSIFPPGTAKRIAAGSTLVFQVHYTPIGVERLDRCSVGLVFARRPVTRLAITKGIACKDLVIPPGARAYPARATFTVPVDALLLSLMPHMHLRGKDFVYQARYPDGRVETLLSVPAYDFAWQSVYRLATPKPLPRGTRLDCLAHFDNSADNPNNPDPSQTVTWGEQTWDEMMIGYIDYSVDLRDAGPALLSSRRGAKTGSR
ncbi:MAG: redoxin domain-containing protein [Isosphaeraceae bacterium]|nr:redoxin domain-containing protein [Isosphaeraceae bacterium]